MANPGRRDEGGWLAFWRRHWWSALVLAVMVWSTAAAMDRARWVEGSQLVFPMAAAGGVAGVLVARWRVSAWISVPLGVLGGGALAFVVVGQLVPPAPEALARFGWG